MSLFYLETLLIETYKIIFLVLPVLTAVALIVWLDRRVWAFVQKKKRPQCGRTIWITTVAC